jgi:hypothetical protein
MTILLAVLSRSSACVQILPIVEAYIPYLFCRTGVIKTGEAGTPCLLVQFMKGRDNVRRESDQYFSPWSRDLRPLEILPRDVRRVVAIRGRHVSASPTSFVGGVGQTRIPIKKNSLRFGDDRPIFECLEVNSYMRHQPIGRPVQLDQLPVGLELSLTLDSGSPPRIECGGPAPGVGSFDGRDCGPGTAMAATYGRYAHQCPGGSRSCCVCHVRFSSY